MPPSSEKVAHKLGSNSRDLARKSRRARGPAESTDLHEDRGAVKSKFSRSHNVHPIIAKQDGATGNRQPTSKPLWPVTKRLLPARGSSAEIYVAHFRVLREGARRVYVAGSFNGWNPALTALARNAAGEWEIALSLPAGAYEYRFVADDEWMDDPRACRTVANPFGGVNAVVQVGPV